MERIPSPAKMTSSSPWSLLSSVERYSRRERTRPPSRVCHPPKSRRLGTDAIAMPGRADRSAIGPLLSSNQARDVAGQRVLRKALYLQIVSNSFNCICPDIKVIERIIKGVVDPLGKQRVPGRQQVDVSRAADHHAPGFVDLGIGIVWYSHRISLCIQFGVAGLGVDGDATQVLLRCSPVSY